MPKQLLISDANILIDIEVGGLTGVMFGLPFKFVTPESLFEEELSETHGGLVKLGLQLETLSPEIVDRVQELANQYRGVSSHDLEALALAEQKQVSLLTGDGKLRQVCLEENINVHGTVWLVGEMLLAGSVSVDDASIAYQRMEDDGSRLPWDDVDKQLEEFRKKE